MKMPLPLQLALRSCTVGVLLLLGHSVRAATYYWDNNGTTAGFGAAAGTWAAPTTGDSTQGWSTSLTGVLTPGNVTTAAADSLNFGADTASSGLASGTITVSGTVSAANLTFGAASGPITLSGGTLAMGGTTGLFTVNNASNTINSAITGTNGLAKTGTGTLTLSGANAYTGTTTLNGGTLKLDGNTGSLAATAITGNGGTFVYDNTNSSGTKTLALGAVTASTGGTTISNVLGGATTSTLTVASQSAHTAGATLNYATSGAGASIVTTTGASFDRGVFFNGANYAIEANNTAITAPTYIAYPGSGSGFFDTNASGGTITAGTSSHWLINQNASLVGGNFGNSTFKFSGSYTLTNTGTLTLGGVLVTGGQAVISGSGSFRVGTGGGDIVIRTDLSSDSLSINQNVVTTNSTTPTLITKSGAGTLVLNGSGNTYGGNTSINEGTLQITRSNGLGFGGNNISTTLGVGTTTVAAGAKLILSGSTNALTVNEPITLNGGSLENDSSANAVTIDSGVAGLQLSNLGSGYSGTISVVFGSGGATATATQSGGVINGLTLTAAGTGYTSAPTVTINGVGGGSGTAIATAVLSSVKLTGTANTIGGAGNLVINAVVANGASSGGFTKTGNGTVTLNGTNTYTGNTTISAGTLKLGASGSIASSPLIVNNSTFDVSSVTGFTIGASQTLKGTGTVIGNTTIVGALAPGNSPGVANFTGDLALGGTSTTTMELAGTGGVAGTDFDKINVTGALTMGGALSIVSYNGFSIDQAGSYNLMDFGSMSGNFNSVSVAGTFLADTLSNGIWTGINGGNTFEYQFTIGDGILVVSAAIPEPSSYAALAGAALLGFAALRRRSRR